METNYDSEFSARHARASSLAAPAGPTISVNDVYFILFRHKWKITVLSLMGLAAGAAIYAYFPRSYISQARLFIRYVQEENKPGAPEAIRNPTARGETIMAGEVAIVQSLDLAQKVADTFGPEKIIGDNSGSANPRLAAAAQIHSGLKVEVPEKSSVLELTFAHENPAIVQPILIALVDAYLKRHMEIHRPGATFDDTYVQQTDQLKARLNQTEQELLRARTKVNIISLEEAKKTFAERINRLRTGIMEAEAESAERQAMLKRLAEGSGEVKAPTTSETPAPLAVDLSTLPLAEYQSLVERFNLVRSRQQELLLLFTAESPRVQAINTQVAELQEKKNEMERKFPNLVRVTPPSSPAQRTSASGLSIDPIVENARIAALTTRIEVLKAQLENVRKEALDVDNVEVEIQELQRRKALEETNYRYFAATLEQSRINEALGAGRVTNISPVQTPSPPSPVKSKAIQFAVVAGLGGIAVGVAWAFLIELFLDRTIKRPVDIRRHLGLNLFLSIPYVKKRHRLRPAAPSPALPAPAGDPTPTKVPHGGASNEMAPWDPSQDMHAYFDTLRDRVIGFFESENLTHKPKLIALAGVGPNGGDANVAAGLASSLSETEDGNVLFVDMTAGQGSTQQFFKGQAINSIDDALVSKEKAQVHDKLFVVTEIGKGDKLPRALPMRFNHLIPKLKASDFDFIIFNMPPVSPISITPRIAGFMDVVLLVVESETTNRDLVAQARDLLAESKTPVGAVLTQTKSYIPKLLGHDAAD